jgi:NADH:ubiquinone oxidoreductase subunit H
MASLASATITFILALIRIAFYTLFERKFLALAQRRKGPNKISLAGIPQPLADALKLFLKQQATPTRANHVRFLIAPAGALSLSLIL